MPRLSLSLRLTLFATLLIVLSVGLGATISYHQSKKFLETSLGKALLSLVNTLAPLINGDMHQLIFLDGEGKLAFQEEFDLIRGQLVRVRDSNKMAGHGSPIYTMRKANDFETTQELEFVVMTDKDATGRYFVGNRYKAQPYQLEALQGKPSTTGIYADAEGTWISAAAPIFDSARHIVGILQADRHIDFFYQQARQQAGTIVLGAIFSVTVVGMLAVFVARRLAQTVEERTVQLAQANAEISTLNQRLAGENLRMSAELDLLRQMQQLVLPTPAELTAIDGLEITAFMEPAEEVGGDYYDVLQTDGLVTIGIGDVTGHGLESGILMVMTQAAVRTLKETREANPVTFLDTLNRTLYRNVQRMHSDKSLTLALLTYDQGHVCISGQHEEAIIVRQGGDIERIDTMDLGFPLGLEMDIANFICHTSVELQPGDGIVLYTDGITEAADINHTLYGIERLCTVLSQHWTKTVRDIQEAVIADVRQHIGVQRVYDDITLVVAKRL